MTVVRIDEAAIIELQDILEDEFDELVDTYIRDTSAKLSLLTQEITADNADEVRKLAHSLKGASVNLGVLKMGSLCHELEEAAKLNQSADFDQFLSAIQVESEWVFEKLLTIKAGAE